MSTRTTYPPGVPCWVALLAPDTDAARRFYTAIFHWTFDNIASTGNPSFYIATLHDNRVAGLGGPEQPGTVSDAGAAAETATACGGQVVVEPQVNDMGFRTAALADPGGARSPSASDCTATDAADMASDGCPTTAKWADTSDAGSSNKVQQVARGS